MESVCLGLDNGKEMWPLSWRRTNLPRFVSLTPKARRLNILYLFSTLSLVEDLYQTFHLCFVESNMTSNGKSGNLSRVKGAASIISPLTGNFFPKYYAGIPKIVGRKDEITWKFFQDSSGIP